MGKKSSHQYIEEHVKEIREPSFTIKGLQELIPGLTYRKINDWDGKGLISGSRDNTKEGWRRFSFVDTVILQLISGLRKFGVDVNKIKSILAESSKLAFSDVTDIEQAIFQCLDGLKLYLRIENESNTISFFTESNTPYPLYGHTVMILPFFTFIEAIRHKLEFKDETIYSVMMTNKETDITDTIKKNEYDQILYTNPDYQTVTISPGPVITGQCAPQDVIKAVHTNSYCTVTVTKKNGKDITVTKKGV